MKTFGNAIAEARKAIGLSQKELAARIVKEDGQPISPQYLNDLEHDRRNAPSQHLILEFTKELKFEDDYLFGLAQAWPVDLAKEVSKASPENVQAAFTAFRRKLSETSKEKR